MRYCRRKPRSFPSLNLVLFLSRSAARAWKTVISVLPLWSQAMTPKVPFQGLSRPCVLGQIRSHHKAEITSPSRGAFGNGGLAEIAVVFLRVRSTQARSETAPAL